MAWESAERVQKNDAGEYRALINGEWMPVAKAQKNEAGQYRVDRGTPETVQSEPATQQTQNVQFANPTIAEQAVMKAVNLPGELRNKAGSLIYGGLRGVKDVLDTGADILSNLGGSEENARIKAMNKAGKDEFTSQYGKDTVAQVGRVGGNILMTAPIGGVFGGGVKMISQSPKALALAEALRTGGMSAGGAGMGTRIAGGALSGGAMAGAINPEDAGTGAVLGGALPGVVKIAGEGGKIIANKLQAREAARLQELAQKSPIMKTMQASREAGYVLPPSYAEGGVASRLLEGLSGKYKTNQLAGIRNQKVSDSLARKAVGLAEDAPLTSEAMQAIRANAYKTGYEPIGQVGTVVTDDAYRSALSSIEKPFIQAEKSFPTGKTLPTEDLLYSLRVNRFDAGDALSKIQNLRDEAGTFYAAGDKMKGKAYKDAAKALEDVIERNLAFKSNAKEAYSSLSKTIGKRMPGADFDAVKAAQKITNNLAQGKITHQMAIEQLGAIGAKSKTASSALKDAADKISKINLQTERAKQLLDNFRSSRTLMAKAHTVEGAIKEGGGHIDATKLASRLQSGKPLSGELETIGKFANNFRDVARMPHSGDANPLTVLDYMSGAVGAGISPYALAVPAGRIVARYGILSSPVQNALVKTPSSGLLSSLALKAADNPAMLTDILTNPATRAGLLSSLQSR